VKYRPNGVYLFLTDAIPDSLVIGFCNPNFTQQVLESFHIFQDETNWFVGGAYEKIHNVVDTKLMFNVENIEKIITEVTKIARIHYPEYMI
jgi:hypothetical protein